MDTWDDTLEAIIREVVRHNDSADGAVGDVRAALGDHAANVLHGILNGNVRSNEGMLPADQTRECSYCDGTGRIEWQRHPA